MAKSSAAPKAPPQPEPTNGGNKPVHSIRYRNLKAAIWRNTGQSGEFHSVTFTRSYRDDQEQWHDATSFNAGDLPMLAKLASDCHTWIEWHSRRTDEEKGGRR
jgi:hypothetical protein